MIYLDRENPVAVIHERKTYLRIDDPANLYYWGMWLDEPAAELADPRLSDFAHSAHEPVVIVDSLIRFHRGEENSATEMSAVMGALRHVAASGATVIVLVHRSDKSLKDYRGSSEILAGCDVLWSLKRQADRKTIELEAKKNRYAAETSLALRLEPGGFMPAETQRESASALRILERLEALGAQVSAQGLNLKVEFDDGSRSEVAPLLPELRRYRGEVLAFLKSGRRVIDGHSVKHIIWETEKAVIFQDQEGPFWRFLHAFGQAWPVVVSPRKKSS